MGGAPICVLSEKELWLEFDKEELLPFGVMLFTTAVTIIKQTPTTIKIFAIVCNADFFAGAVIKNKLPFKSVFIIAHETLTFFNICANY